MAKTIKQVTIEIDNFVKAINQDLQLSSPSKLLDSSKLGALAQGAIFAAISARFSFVEHAIEQNILLEKRRHTYQAHYPEKPLDYKEALSAYQSIVEMGQATRENFTPDRAFWIGWGLRWVEGQWLTVKEMAERMMRKSLPDIDPEDAIELGKTTPFSAEQWFRGCSDRKFWE